MIAEWRAWRQRKLDYKNMVAERNALFILWMVKVGGPDWDPEYAFEQAVEHYERTGYYFSRADHVRMWELGIKTDNERLPYSPNAFERADEIR